MRSMVSFLVVHVVNNGFVTAYKRVSKYLVCCLNNAYL